MFFHPKDLKIENDNPWFKLWFNILLHTQSIVCATADTSAFRVLGIYNFGQQYNIPSEVHARLTFLGGNLRTSWKPDLGLLIIYIFYNQKEVWLYSFWTKRHIPIILDLIICMYTIFMRNFFLQTTWFAIFALSTLKFMFSKKATKIDEIFTVDLTFTT